MKTRTAAAICLMIVGLATAASGTTFLYVPTPEDDAISKAAGKAAIATSGAPWLFENQSEALSIRVSHRASGLSCHFDKNDDNRIELRPNARHVEEIRCTSTDYGYGDRTHAVRITGRADVEATALAAVEALRKTFDNATPARRAPCSPPYRYDEPLPIVCYEFEGEKSGDKLRIWSGTLRTRDWIVTQHHEAWDGYGPEIVSSVGDMNLRGAIAEMPRSP